jgi:inorganic pyrophosphatase/exopolyphosphatase
MSEYHKIETLFERDPKSFVVDPTRLKASVLSTISEWDVTEKEAMSERYAFEVFSFFGFAGALLALWLMGAFA